MKCRSCGKEDRFTEILALGEQPWCNDFLLKEDVGKEKKYPLTLMHCGNCELLQLTHTVAKETMFGDHTYLSGMTKTLVQHFYDVAKENVEQFHLTKDDLIVDIGGNDGSQLLQYKNMGIPNVLNVECATTVSQIAIQNGITTSNDYFNMEFVDEHLGPRSVKLYNASGVFFHLEELHSVIEGIKYSLKKRGVLVVQFMYAGAMVEGLNFDTIYHEHLCYYTLRSLENLLRPHGLEVFDAYYSDIHSGSIIAKITHSGGELNHKTTRFWNTLATDEKYTLEAFKRFAETVKTKRTALKALLTELKGQGKTIYAYGAPAKGNTLLNYFGIDNTLIDKAVEVNELKVGRYLPGSHIPIVRESEEDRPDYYLLLSHNFAKELLAKNKGAIEQGTKFILPFPEVRII